MNCIGWKNLKNTKKVEIYIRNTEKTGFNFGKKKISEIQGNLTWDQWAQELANGL